MKNLLLLLTLFVSFNCIGQPKSKKFANDWIYDTASYFKYTDSNFYIKPIKLQEFKIHIDSAYLQKIIEALEERGYTLVKLPKKQ